MDIDKQANGNKRRGIDKTTIDDVRKGNNKDKIWVEGRMLEEKKEGDEEVQPD